MQIIQKIIIFIFQKIINCDTGIIFSETLIGKYYMLIVLDEWSIAI